MNKSQEFTSIWDALENTPEAAASMRARSDLMIALQLWVKRSKKTQAEAAQLLRITQPRMSDLMRGKITLFSLDSLMDMATIAGLEPRISVNMSAVEQKVAGVDEELSASESEGVVREVRPLTEDIAEFFLAGATESPSTQVAAAGHGRPGLTLVTNNEKAA